MSFPNDSIGNPDFNIYQVIELLETIQNGATMKTTKLNIFFFTLLKYGGQAFAISLLTFSFSLAQVEETTNAKVEEKTKVEKPNSTQAITDKIEFKNETTNPILTITDEGSNAASILIPQGPILTDPNDNDKLYNVGGTLHWNGNAVGTSGSAGGWTDDGTNIYNTTLTDKVGIGTNSPNGKLGIKHNSSISDPHIFLHEDGNDYARMNFKNNNGSNYWTIEAYVASNSRNDRLNFWNGASGDLLSLTGDGRLGLNVGISPKTSFHVGDGGRVLFGADTLGNGDKLMFLPDLHAFRVGTLATGAASTYWDRDSIGLYSFASGYNTRAQGYGATAMGRDTEATNSYAFASGYFSNADGQYSTAMGFNTDALAIASSAFGYSTNAESYSSFAIGRLNVGGGNRNSWVETDPLFEIGIGTINAKANAVTVLKNGNFGIGESSPGYKLHVKDDQSNNFVARIENTSIGTDADGLAILLNVSTPASSNHFIRFQKSGGVNIGNITGNGNSVNYNTTSDARLKMNIEEYSNALNTLSNIGIKKYERIANPGIEEIGVIAQELQKVYPQAVSGSPDGDVKTEPMMVDYSKLTPLLVKAVQEQQEKIKELERQNSEIRRQNILVGNKNIELENRLSKIESLVDGKRFTSLNQ